MNSRIACVLVACAAALAAEAPRVALLEIKLENWTNYRLDVVDPLKLAAEAKLVPPVAMPTFQGWLGIADIVSVNGRPAKGLWCNQGHSLAFSPNPAPRFPIANVESGEPCICMYSFYTADGAFVGKLVDGGHSGGPGGTHPILAGLGAFLGATGEHGWADVIGASRRASIAEDPSLRHTFGGGAVVTRVYLVPKQWPEVEMSAAGPSVLHGADWSPVTAAKPASAGEVLLVRAKGLGPTRPRLIPPGFKPFGDNPPEEVNSPVEVSVGGKAAEVLNKVGWPGTYDTYRVDIRVPSGITPGMAPLQLTAAWISGPEVRIAVQ